MKLISMTDFVLKQKSREYSITAFSEVLKYAKLIKQPLELWMFVPCDEEGNVLEEPNGDNYRKDEEKLIPNFNYLKYKIDSEIYQQAKERCLFEGLYLCEDGFIRAEDSYILFSKEGMIKETIEDMIYYQTTLTQTAIKKLGL